MGLIQVLSEQVANQIAAGEVVERPASVVKELVENSIDSGATQIEVRIKGGGLELILVQDNGSGIGEGEIETAFIRHATSKLRAISDFSHLRTLGFRGEALPSIASVSKVALRTKRQMDLSATEVSYAGGALVARQPTGGPAGTRVQVSDLFFNTPARLKFVRSLQTETAHIADVVSRAAMAHPAIAFTLSADDRLLLQTAGDGQSLSVFAALYGANVAKMAMAVSGEHPDYQVAGLVSAPEHARANRNVMWFSVNGRPIRSPLLLNAVLDGFGTNYHKGRFPVTFLALAMAPTLVDVNVHPGKLEVRFSEEKDVRDFVVKAVQEALLAGAHIPQVTSGTPPEPAQNPGSAAAAWTKVSAGSGDGGYRLPEKPAFSSEAVKEKTLQAALWSQQPVRAAVAVVDAAGQGMPEVGQDRADALPEAPKGELRAVAQVLKMFIVAEDGESVYLIDQHAAHERVLYERLRAKLQAGTVRELELLVPLSFEMRSHEVDLILRQQAVAQRFGLFFEAFGENAIVVRTIPNIWEGLDTPGLIRDVFDDFLLEKDVSPFAKLEDKVVMSACKAAVKANQRLSLVEMDALLKALSSLDNPFTCPHGRPTALKIARADLERRFLR